MTVDCSPAEVLQGGQVAAERPSEIQGDLLPRVVNVVDHTSPGDAGHVELNQFEDTVKARNSQSVVGVRLQVERVRVTLDPHTLRADHRLDAEGEQVSVVRAVPDKEGPDSFLLQQSVGLLAGDAAPVEATV